jgi:RNA polymerase-binding transcription factor DksA
VEQSGAPGATSFDEADLDVSVLDAIERELTDVEHALSSMEDGTYGQCEVCGRSIPDADLAQRPAGRLCGDHLLLDPA